MRKRIFSILLTLCMALSLMPTVAFAAGSYDVWVGGIQVTSDNANDVLRDGTVSYDATTHTITLNNATIIGAHKDTSGYRGIDYSGAIFSGTGHPLSIELVGVNTVVCPESTDDYNAGILCLNSLNITGSGSLNAKGGKTNMNSFGIRVDYELNISGNANVTATGIIHGLSAENVNISGNATVTATGGKGGSNSIGLCGHNVNISDNAIVLATGDDAVFSYGVCAYQNINITDAATVTATGGNGYWCSYGIYSWGEGDVTISDTATVTAVGSKSNDKSCGIYTENGNTNISNNALLIARGGDATTSQAVNPAVNCTGASALLCGDNDQDFAVWGVSGKYTVLTNELSDLGSTTVGEDFNSSEAETGYYWNGIDTLTLKNVIINATDNNGSDSNTYGIKLPPDTEVDLNLEGMNTISAGNAASYSSFNGYGIYSNSKITISGNGDLTVFSASVADNSYGVYSNNIVINNDGTVTAFGASAINSIGVYAASSVTINDNSILNAIGASTTHNSAGICSSGSIHVNDNSMLNAIGGSTINSYGVYASNGFTVNDNSMINAIGGSAANSSYGVYAGNDFTINEYSTINAIGGWAADSSYGVYASNDFTINEYSTISANGGLATDSWGVYSNTVTISGNVIAIGDLAATNSCGINAGNVTVSAGTTIASGSSQAMYSASVETFYTVPYVIFVSTDPDGSNVSEWDNNTDLTTYKYLKIAPKYLLNVNPDGGSGSTISDYYTAGSIIPIDAGIKSGYKFNGWREANALGTFANSSHTSTTYSMPAANATLTANWKRIINDTDYYLTFETSGGSAMSQLREATGTTIDLSKYTPTRNAYDFAGWYSDEALTEKITSVSLTENVTIYAKWTKQEEQTKPVEPTEPMEPTEPEKQVTNPFSDVPNDQYYHDAVLWAVNAGISSGTSENTFSPDKGSTREQAITFLWRAVGSPESTLTSCPFIDVAKDEYYYKAVLWALETGITNGTTPTTFGTNTTVTRSQATTFLWRAAGSPKASSQNPFGDITMSAYDYDAVLWAVEQNITHGTSANSFSPQGLCTRGQLLTFLFRYINK